MSNDGVGELLLAWEEAAERGQAVTAEELCATCPELIAPLRRAIEALKAFEPALVDHPTNPQAPSFPPPAHRVPPVAGYEILDELGRGGMGVIYKARQAGLNRLVALKMILAGSLATREQLARFRAEAELLARLIHPHIVAIHEVGEHNGLPYFTLEYVEGGTLADWLSEALPSPREAARLVEVLAGAVEAAHRQGVIHRDLKPANVLLGTGGGPSAVPLGGALRVPKVSDFGLAKGLGDAPNLTGPGAILGTPSYMAPEQARGDAGEVGPLADVYALGAVLYECLTGRPPFRAAAPAETVVQVLYEEPVAPRSLQLRLPRELETICLKCLSKWPGQRYGGARELADDLRRFLAGEPILARPVGLVGRAVKWARRRPLAAGLMAAVVAVTALGGGLVTWKWREAERQKKIAEKNLDQTVALFAAYRAGVDSYNRFVTADAAWRPENLPRLRLFLLGTTVQLEQALVEVTRDDADTVEGRAVEFDRLLTFVAGRVPAEKALEFNEKAVEKFKELAAKFPDRSMYDRLLAGAYARLGVVHEGKGDPARAEECYRAAMDWLGRARDRGHFESRAAVDSLNKDPALAPLRGREEFRRLPAK